MTASNGLLTGRTALATGGSRGIGLAIAQRFAAEGAMVAVSARTVEPGSNQIEGSLTETDAKITGAGGQAVAIPADLSRLEERERLVLKTESTLGRVDMLVNNAAVTWYMPVADFTPKRLELMIQLQVYVPMDLAQRVLPSVVAAGQGWILNISSGASRHPTVPPGDRWRGSRSRLWHVQGRPRAVDDGAGRGGLGIEHRRELPVTDEARVDPGNPFS